MTRRSSRVQHSVAGLGIAIACTAAVAAAGTVPETPAFSYLEVSPSRIARPMTARDVGAQLVQGIDSTGQSVSGLAVEVTPWFLFPGGVTLDQYKNERARRMWANLRASLATAQAAGVDGATDAAIGIHLPIIDRGDPLLSDAFTSGVRGKIKLPTGFPPSPEVARRDSAERSQAYGKYWDDYVAANQGKFRLSVAFASGIRRIDSNFEQSYGSGGAAWLDAGGRLFPWLDVTGHVEWRERRAIPGQAYQRTLKAGARADISGSRSNLFAEWLPQWDHPEPADAKSKGHWSAGIEFKLADNLWAATGLSSSYGLEEGASRVALIANMRWALSTKSQLLK